MLLFLCSLTPMGGARLYCRDIYEKDILEQQKQMDCSHPVLAEVATATAKPHSKSLLSYNLIAFSSKFTKTQTHFEGVVASS